MSASNLIAAIAPVLKTIGLRPASLDAPVADDEDAALSETIADEEARTPLELLREKDFLGKIDIVLRSLNKREATIIEYRFGLNGLAAKTLEQVSELIGVTRERVGQLDVRGWRQDAAVAFFHRQSPPYRLSKWHQKAVPKIHIAAGCNRGWPDNQATGRNW